MNPQESTASPCWVQEMHDLATDRLRIGNFRMAWFLLGESTGKTMVLMDLQEGNHEK